MRSCECPICHATIDRRRLPPLCAWRLEYNFRCHVCTTLLKWSVPGAWTTGFLIAMFAGIAFLGIARWHNDVVTSISSMMCFAIAAALRFGSPDDLVADCRDRTD